MLERPALRRQALARAKSMPSLIFIVGLTPMQARLARTTGRAASDTAVAVRGMEGHTILSSPAEHATNLRGRVPSMRLANEYAPVQSLGPRVEVTHPKRKAGRSTPVLLIWPV